MSRFKDRFCNSIGLYYKIMDLKMCINSTNSRWLLPNSLRALPISCRVCLRGMVTMAGCILMSWIWSFRKVTVPWYSAAVTSQLPAKPRVFYFWGIVWLLSLSSSIDLISDQCYLILPTVSLNLTDQAWLRQCGSCLSLSFLLSSLLQPDTFPQLPQKVL